jgi:hypothetical protein
MRIDKDGRDVTSFPGLWSDEDSMGLSVGELIERLKQFDQSTPVILTYRGESELLTQTDVFETTDPPPRKGGYLDGPLSGPMIRYVSIGS